VQDNTSTDDLLKKLIKINEEQNKLLDKNNNTSQKLNYLILIFAAISFLAALASTQIAALQLQASNIDDCTGVGIFWLLFIIVMILLIIAVYITWWWSPKKLKEST